MHERDFSPSFSPTWIECPVPELVDPVVDPQRLAGIQQPEIDADDLLLRPWSVADAQCLVEAFSDEEIQRWHLWSLVSEAEAADWVAEGNDRWQRKVGASWAVLRVDDRGAVVGQVSFRSLYLADGLAEVGYWVLPAARRTGVASQATRALADWAIDDLGLMRLELVHSVHNPPSCGVALRAGFRVEGTKRMLQRHLDGIHDMHLHSRVRGD